MKRLILAALCAVSLGAAPPNPVSWKIQGAPARPVKAGGRFVLQLAAQIENGWHLYSTKPLSEGPIPTRIWLPEGQPFESAGPLKSPAPESVHDPNFDMEVEFYQGQAVFAIPVKVAPNAPAGPRTVQVSASYQSCNDKLCLPPRTVKLEAPVEVSK